MPQAWTVGRFGPNAPPADRALIKQIMHDPSGYYVNLHNAPHPGGVMRAQLSG